MSLGRVEQQRIKRVQSSVRSVEKELEKNKNIPNSLLSKKDIEVVLECIKIVRSLKV